MLIVGGSLQETARLADVDEGDLKEQLARAREILFEERKNRPPPHLDTKMITAWNGKQAGLTYTTPPRSLTYWRRDRHFYVVI